MTVSYHMQDEATRGCSESMVQKKVKSTETGSLHTVATESVQLPLCPVLTKDSVLSARLANESSQLAVLLYLVLANGAHGVADGNSGVLRNGR